jgi:hypothetical protein
MILKPVSAPATPGLMVSAGLLAVPAGAVLDSGTRRMVYVESGRGRFESREVTLGPRCGDFFPVLTGLVKGERVVTRGGFLIDSQFQIAGYPSLYYPGGLIPDTGPRPAGAAGPESSPIPADQSKSRDATDSSAPGHQH